MTDYLTLGGGLRAVDVAGPLGDHFSNAFIARRDLPSFEPADDDTRRVVSMVRKILTRGSVPPLDPAIERELLESRGLSVLPNRVAGDLACQISPSDRSRLTADLPDTLAVGPSMVGTDLGYDSEPERVFHQQWIPEHLGVEAARWFLPQAPLDRLLFAAGQDDQDLLAARRVDFLVTAPWLSPFIVEIDGAQHAHAAAVDAGKDAALEAAGIDVIRIPTAELQQGAGPNLQAVSDRWRDPQRGDGANATLMASPAQLHRTLHAVTEAVVAGFLLGDRWIIDLHDDLGVCLPHIGSLLSLFAAMDALWGGAVAPSHVEVRDVLAHQTIELIREEQRYRLVEVDDLSDEPDVAIFVEATRTPVEHLPDTTVPAVVMRPATLPVELRSDTVSVNRRISVKTRGADTPAALKTLLRSVFAKDDFRDGQLEAVIEVLEGRDCVVLLPTGAGKSLIYQLAGLVLPGITLIIDPIVALMEDQVRGLAGHGIDKVAAISSHAGASQKVELMNKVATADAQFVFIAPERLQQQAFRSALVQLSAATPVNLAVIDEAHCVSEWGHDFRTAYLNLGPNVRRLCADTASVPPPILALTGTASRAVLRDVLFELEIDGGRSPNTLIRPATFDRPELGFEILKAEPSTADAMLKGYVQALPGRFARPTAGFFQPNGDDTFAGIVFCPHVNGKYGVWDVAEDLATVMGTQPLSYSGSAPKAFGSKGAWTEQKRINAEKFKRNDVSTLVATKSFGMGIDKPNVRWVVHYGIPGSIESYYQEAGRAGRDGGKSLCAIVLSEHDEDRARRLLDEDIELAAARTEHEGIGWKDADDISRALFFHFRTFRGRTEDLEEVDAVLDLIGDFDKAKTVEIPFHSDSQDTSRERAIHRLAVLGIVQDYLVDWGGKSFELRIAAGDGDGVVRNLLAYIGRSQPGRVAVIQRRLDDAGWEKPREAAVACASELITFVYDTIERSRRRSLREMWLAARAGDGEDLRARILDYLSEGDVAPVLEHLLNTDEVSLVEWRRSLDQITLPEDAAEWRGNTARLLASEPDHPGLLLARAISELRAANGQIAEFDSNLAAAITSAQDRYAISEDELTETGRWIFDRFSGRSDVLAATWHQFEVHGVGGLRALALARLDVPDPPPGLAMIHLDIELGETLRQLGDVDAHYSLSR